MTPDAVERSGDLDRDHHNNVHRHVITIGSKDDVNVNVDDDDGDDDDDKFEPDSLEVSPLPGHPTEQNSSEVKPGSRRKISDSLAANQDLGRVSGR